MSANPAGKSIREIKLTNTLTGKKEPLVTREPGKLKMYSCGPTVYGLIHIGNLRAALVADMLFRYFQRVGYAVTYVRNYTDVDDKIINRGHEEKIPAEEVARRYTAEVEKDYAVAGLLEPTHKTTVTTHMPEIIAMIQRIIANGKGYVVEAEPRAAEEAEPRAAEEAEPRAAEEAEPRALEKGGEVNFSIESFPDYGKLSHKQIDDLVAGIRVEVNTRKKNPLDFALWKPAKPGEPFWESPWGKGRPGWHIECSAMAGKWLGDQIDVHHGGEDLIFPHHENEIAQSEASSGKEPFVRYWLHHAFLTMSREKMSKSLGNVLSARDFLTQYGAELARYVLLSVHYRSIIDFSDETIEHAVQGLHRIYEAKAKAVELQGQARARVDLRAEGVWGSFVAACEQARREIDDAYASDLNTAGALGALFSLIREFNRAAAEPLAAATPSAVLGASELIRVMEEEIGSVMGLGRLEPRKALEDLARVRALRSQAPGLTRPTHDEIQRLIQERADARKGKDFARGDQIRKDLEARGVLIKDSPTGTTWEYK